MPQNLVRPSGIHLHPDLCSKDKFLSRDVRVNRAPVTPLMKVCVIPEEVLALLLIGGTSKVKVLLAVQPLRRMMAGA